ncbi:MAG: hypothetical protein WCW04_03230 [Candidatus Paceibacterota bacterium]
MTKDTEKLNNEQNTITGQPPVNTGVLRDEFGKILPGSKSLNPNGAPKGKKHLSTLLRQALEKQSDIEIDGKYITYAEAIISNLLKIATKAPDREAIKGIAEVFDRDEGKARGSLNIDPENEVTGIDITIVHTNTVSYNK